MERKPVRSYVSISVDITAELYIRHTCTHMYVLTREGGKREQKGERKKKRGKDRQEEREEKRKGGEKEGARSGERREEKRGSRYSIPFHRPVFDLLNCAKTGGKAWFIFSCE